MSTTIEDSLAHDAMVLAHWALVAEACPLEQASRGVVQEGRRRLLPLRVLRIRLHHAAARLRDQVQGPV